MFVIRTEVMKELLQDAVVSKQIEQAKSTEEIEKILATALIKKGYKIQTLP